MNGNLDNITFDIKELKKTEDGARYKIAIQVPMSMGFIERMKFIIESSTDNKTFTAAKTVTKAGKVTVGGLNTGTKYYFRLKVCNEYFLFCIFLIFV